ncbi:MAG TPA: DUF2169 domain-containing protein [Gemmatimonadales bacterium]|nr:DUF2169 domain-containing protein [Gemmatimonadales bacterium]
MFQIENQTPLATALSLFTDKRGASLASVAVKGTFDIHGTGALNVAQVQQPVFLKDVHYGDPADSSLKYPCELVMNKRATDVGLVGHAHSPTGKPVNQLDASLRVGHLRKAVRVFGDRVWEAFGVSTAQPFTSMPLVYERCFGGAADPDGDRPVEFCETNPVGVGFKSSKSTRTRALPNIEDPLHLMSRSGDRPPVAGLGFVAPSWQPRRQYAGTYDEKWQNDVFPILPADFDDRFFNCAVPPLMSDGFLQGGEEVDLIGLCAAGPVRFRLPAIVLWLDFVWRGETTRRRADMWTVTLEPDDGRYSVVWGAAFDVLAQPASLRKVRVTSKWSKV